MCYRILIFQRENERIWGLRVPPVGKVARLGVVGDRIHNIGHGLLLLKQRMQLRRKNLKQKNHPLQCRTLPLVGL